MEIRKVTENKKQYISLLDTVFRTVGLALKLHSAQLTFMRKQAYSPLKLSFL